MHILYTREYTCNTYFWFCWLSSSDGSDVEDGEDQESDEDDENDDEKMVTDTVQLPYDK